MKWFLNFPTRSKLLLSFGLMILLLGGAIATGYRDIQEIQGAGQALYEEDFRNVWDLKDLLSNQNAMRTRMLTMTLMTRRSEQTEIEAGVKNLAEKSDELMRNLVRMNRDETQQLSKLEEWNAIRIANKQIRETQVIPLIHEGKTEDARQLILGIQAEWYAKMQAIVGALVERAETRARAATARSEQTAQRSLRIFAMVGAVALLIGLALAAFLNRIIAGPLKGITAVAERVAANDLTVRIPPEDRTDEVGVLGQTFRRMVENIREVERQMEERTAALQAEVAERRRAEEALQQSEARYRNLVKNATYGVSLIGADGKYVEVNRAMVEMLGYASEEEVLSLDIATQLYRDAEDQHRFLEEAQKTGRFRGLEIEMKRKDGKIIRVRRSGRVVQDDENLPQSYEVITEDITERDQLERQVQQLSKFEAIGRLAGGVAHDFNNHLGIIMGYSEQLLERLDGPNPLRRSAAMIKDATLRAASLTRQLLAFSRRQVLEPRVLDLNQIVSEMGKMLKPLIGEDIQLLTLQDPDLGQVRADPAQIEQVIMNLAVNARDAMPRGGKLTIETANLDLDEAYCRRHSLVEPGRYARLVISDTGIGMDREIQAHLFEPFFTTKESGKGTGLGLATVYGIVKQSGGYVWVYSEPGLGATFEIYLPRLEGVVQVAPAEKPSRSALKGSETVLMVEDEELLREVAGEFLKSSGYTVLEASNGTEAIEISNRHQGPIQLLITDAVMPGMSGRELAERLKALRQEIKILYVSGYTDDAILRHGLLDPATAFLQKPFTRDGLGRKVREVLESKKDRDRQPQFAVEA